MAKVISNTASGERAVEFVLAQVKCAYCEKALVDLPRATPVYDVACSRCEFRAQVKSVETHMRRRIRGASARPLAGLRLAGKSSPPLIVVWGWDGEARSAERVTLYPLVPWRHIRERALSQNHETMAGRLMVDYHDLHLLPFFELYP
jgi:DNA-directed RNA polymerase subunit RPC12/RpoP